MWDNINSEEDFKNKLIDDINFMLNGNEINEENCKKILDFISLEIASFSHEVINNKATVFSDGYIGHMMRKNFRIDMIIFVKEYLRTIIPEVII